VRGIIEHGMLVKRKTGLQREHARTYDEHSTDVGHQAMIGKPASPQSTLIFFSGEVSVDGTSCTCYLLQLLTTSFSGLSAVTLSRPHARNVSFVEF
jgi:hypothetical protein